MRKGREPRGACMCRRPFLAQRRQLTRQALALRLVLHDKPVIPRSPATMGEAEKGEGFRTPLAALLTSQGRKPAEFDQPRLVLVERQAKLGQPVLATGLARHRRLRWATPTSPP